MADSRTVEGLMIYLAVEFPNFAATGQMPRVEVNTKPAEITFIGLRQSNGNAHSLDKRISGRSE